MFKDNFVDRVFAFVIVVILTFITLGFYPIYVVVRELKNQTLILEEIKKDLKS